MSSSSKKVSVSCTAHLSFFMRELWHSTFFFCLSFFFRLCFIVDLIYEILLTFLVAEKSSFLLLNRFNQPCFNFEPKFIVHSIQSTSPYLGMNKIDLLETEWNFLQRISIFDQEGMIWMLNSWEATFHSCCCCRK